MRIFIVFKKRRELFTVEDYLQNVCQRILRKVKFLQLEVCPKTYHQLYMSKVLPQSCMHKEAKSRCLEENFTFQAKEFCIRAFLGVTKTYPKLQEVQKPPMQGPFSNYSYCCRSSHRQKKKEEESMQICSAQSNVIITRQVRDILLSYSQSTAAHESRDIMPW